MMTKKTETESDDDEEEKQPVSDDLPPVETPYIENMMEELGQVGIKLNSFVASEESIEY